MCLEISFKAWHFFPEKSNHAITFIGNTFEQQSVNTVEIQFQVVFKTIFVWQ